MDKSPKDWFNNKRAKFRKNQRAIMTKKHRPPTKDDLIMKTLVESKNVVILQEQKRLFYYNFYRRQLRAGPLLARNRDHRTLRAEVSDSWGAISICGFGPVLVMAQKLYYEYRRYNEEDDEEGTNREDELGIVASTSAPVMAAAGVGHSGRATGRSISGRSNEPRQVRESQSHSLENDDDFSDLEEPSTSAGAAARGNRRRRAPQRRRGRRGTFQFTPWQVDELENLFEENQYPDVTAREELARTLNVPEGRVKAPPQHHPHLRLRLLAHVQPMQQAGTGPRAADPAPSEPAKHGSSPERPRPLPRPI
ncbi:hypothetical protein A6R68_17079 [Neotoma lepida]|uniref:Homeobox domain-containing protein n=1 Tax=Neotoma lepida TaxID=56216 RepID=A0A1A6HEV4_NEOLE|nr:hypothetical protein A6R68_17079 [Neotoma lepida]